MHGGRCSHLRYRGRLTQRLRPTAVEVLVQALDRADVDSGRTLLADIEEQELYEAAVTVMMRLVFLFSAEERGLLLLGDPLYDQHYAVSPLAAQLRNEADRVGLEVLERRQDAWSRLSATFRGIYGGIDHDRLKLPAYGGSLFDPDRFPFLEGRAPGTSWRDTPSEMLPIDNRTVLHLLEALQILRMRGRRGAVEARRLSFRALDVEQIGHVYEGLLDHTAIRIEQPHLGLAGAKGLEPEIALRDLEAAHTDSEDTLVELLKRETGRSASALCNALEIEPDQPVIQRLRVTCSNDDEFVERVLPYHALLRDDVWRDPTVYRAGSVIVTAGLDRRSTQTFYTPRALAEEIVQYALEPLVYEGPAEGRSRDQWTLRSVEELLELKICDPTMGSGAFLVAVCRWLGERIVEAWATAEERLGTITVEGRPSEGRADETLLPRDREERLVVARRLVAERCIYGVDINPFAVEMAKMSIWPVTLAKNRPFGFIDHALRCGDSLVGATDIDQLRFMHLDPEQGRSLDKEFWFDFEDSVAPAVDEAQRLRAELEAFPVVGPADAERKAALHEDALAAISRARLIGDAVAACAMADAAGAGEVDTLLRGIRDNVAAVASGRSVNEPPFLEDQLDDLLNTDLPEGRPRRRTFHWPLEFPEVFGRGRPGFDAIVANPPFLGGKRISGQLGLDYREHLVRQVAFGARGNADLVAYFMLRFCQLVRTGGCIGSLATNSIAQGDSRRVGLEQALARAFSIARARRSRGWLYPASLEVSELWLWRGAWDGAPVRRRPAAVPWRRSARCARLAARPGMHARRPSTRCAPCS